MTDQGKNGEFHRADPAWRRRMQVVLAACVVVGAGALALLWRWLSGVAASADEGGNYDRLLTQALGGVCIVLGFASAGFALWLFRLAAATRSEKRWPPSSMRTSADMRIRYLSSADRLVTQMKGGAFGLVLLGAGLVAWGSWLLLHA